MTSKITASSLQTHYNDDEQVSNLQTLAVEKKDETLKAACSKLAIGSNFSTTLHMGPKPRSWTYDQFEKFVWTLGNEILSNFDKIDFKCSSSFGVVAPAYLELTIRITRRYALKNQINARDLFSSVSDYYTDDIKEFDIVCDSLTFEVNRAIGEMLSHFGRNDRVSFDVNFWGKPYGWMRNDFHDLGMKITRSALTRFNPNDFDAECYLNSDTDVCTIIVVKKHVV